MVIYKIKRETERERGGRRGRRENQ